MKSEPVLKMGQNGLEVAYQSARALIEAAKTDVRSTMSVPGLPHAKISPNPEIVICAELNNLQRELEGVNAKSEVLDKMVRFFEKIEAIIESDDSKDFIMKTFPGSHEKKESFWQHTKLALLNGLQRDITYIAQAYGLDQTFLAQIAGDNALVTGRRSARPSDRWAGGEFPEGDEFSKAVSPEQLDAMFETAFSIPPEPPEDDSALPEFVDAEEEVGHETSLLPPALKGDTEEAYFEKEKEGRVRRVFKEKFVAKYANQFQSIANKEGGSFRKAASAIAANAHFELSSLDEETTPLRFYREFFDVKSVEERNKMLVAMVSEIFKNQAWGIANDMLAKIESIPVKSLICTKTVIKNDEELCAYVAHLTNRFLANIKGQILSKRQFNDLIWMAYFFFDEDVETESGDIKSGLDMRGLKDAIYNKLYPIVAQNAYRPTVEGFSREVQSSASATIASVPVIAHPKTPVRSTMRPTEASAPPLHDLVIPRPAPLPMPPLSEADYQQAKRLETVFGLDDPAIDDEPTLVTAGTPMVAPEVEVIESELSGDELAAVLDDVGVEDPDNEITRIFPIPKVQPNTAGLKKVTFASGIVAKEVPPAPKKVALGGRESAYTLPPQANPEPKAGELQKPSLLQRIRSSKAFKKAIQTVAAGATILMSGAVPGSGVGQLNYGERQPDIMDTTPAPTPQEPIAKNSPAPVEDDTTFETVESKYSVNEKALKGSKLLATMIHEGGFKRAPGYKGDFTTLNFRLTDNATPEQMAAIRKVYVKYEKGRIHAQRNINSEEAAFFHSTNEAFEKEGIGKKDHKGDLRINWPGGEAGSWATFDWKANPFNREMLIARGVLQEKNQKSAPDVSAPTNVNVPIDYQIAPEQPSTPKTPVEIIHTMNQNVEGVLNGEKIDVLGANDIIVDETNSDSPDVSFGETELSLAELEEIEVDAGWDDIVVAPGKTSIATRGAIDTSTVDSNWA